MFFYFLTIFCGGILTGIVIWCAWSISQPEPRSRELLLCQWDIGDVLLKQNIGWRLAPEEDNNAKAGWVYLERDLPLEQP